MMKRIIAHVELGVLAALVAAGCGGQKNPLLVPNQPPEVELFAQPVDHSANGPYAYRLQWAGRDPDGRIDHFLYALASPAADSRAAGWTSTTARERALSFPARAAAPARVSIDAIEPTVFSVLAVDGAGAKSEPARVAFFQGALAPMVRITSPPPNPLIRLHVAPSLCVEWEGTAFGDSVSAGRITEYKYILLTELTGVSVTTARANPDSVRRYYAPRNWEGWTSVDDRVTSAVLRDLTPEREYIFAITCFDDAGNYDPIFSFSKNMLYMRVLTAAASLPTIEVTSPFGHYSAAGFDPSQAVNVEVPAGRPLTFNWSATAAQGRRITGYRWALDLPDLPDDARPPGNPLPGRWSPWRLTTTSATIGPFDPVGSEPETHTLRIEARDNSGCSDDEVGISLVTLRLSVIRPSFNRELLIVDDTRLLLDRISPGTTCSSPSNRPIGNWPTAAELDTFLYARGGTPWRCYPTGTLSTPGVFNGYPFDTIGTRLGIADLTVPFSTLSQYRHVIWLTDALGAHNDNPGYDLAEAQTSMRYMNSTGIKNTLAAYAAWGGKVWLAGGGAATAATINFNRPNNDNSLPVPRALTFSYDNQELVPGRFIYDQTHWRSEFKQFRVSGGRIRRYLGRFESNPGIYQSLPAEMQAKTPVTDPFPPNRTGQSPSVFYQTQFDIEFLSAANEILEDKDPRPNHEDFQPALDSLFKATAPTLRPDTGPDALQSVVMTYYHGSENAPFVHTGFSIWSYQRAQCVALVDFVLQQLWGLTRQGPAAGPVVEEVKATQPAGRQSRPREGPVSAAAPAAGRGK